MSFEKIIVIAFTIPIIVGLWLCLWFLTLSFYVDYKKWITKKVSEIEKENK